MGYAEQAVLTERHRLAQARLMALIARDLTRLWPLLDLGRLDATFPTYAQIASAVIQSRSAVSAQLGADYYRAFRADAKAAGLFTASATVLADPMAINTSLAVTGPVAIKSALASGATYQQATEAALAGTIRAAQRHVMSGGRNTMVDLVRKDPGSVGYARVTDGNPCAFCAMLASRGPVYKSRQSASTRFSNSAFGNVSRYHDGCGCTVQPVFDHSAPWPGDAEQYRQLWDESTAGYGGASARAEFRRAFEAASGG